MLDLSSPSLHPGCSVSDLRSFARAGGLRRSRRRCSEASKHRGQRYVQCDAHLEGGDAMQDTLDPQDVSASASPEEQAPLSLIPLPLSCASTPFSCLPAWIPCIWLHSWPLRLSLLNCICPPNLLDSQVEQFYDFWFSFKSWREFPHPDEEDPEQAECREHKRWIER